MTQGSPQVWIDWLCRRALPLWSEAGYDAESGSFVERLALDGRPQWEVPRRVMVQARQIHVFATAAANGWFSGADELAMRAGDAMVARYWDADAGNGWAFSCTRQGAIVDARRDLYAHGFVLLALAGLVTLDAQPRHVALVHRTLAFLDRAMAHPAGGYAEQCPGVLPRRQNPHMHLLEAFLALHETGNCGDFRPRIAAMIDLFDRRFLSAEDDVLSEYYGEDWTPVDDGRAFEPGHHFEWAWLLARTAAITGIDMAGRIERLLRTAQRGVDARGGVVDQMGPGEPVAADYRLWPATEAAKAFDLPQGRAVRASGTSDVLAAAWQSFITPAIAGGWIDRVDPRGAPLVDHIPASSLYHICTALDYLR
ncbi:mannose-6-phosphate isomerase [Sphingomonas hengshuiensis]|uniref:Mannose-6-phosphate isomerase n=1 Tax=Sphingomonas hengshuiensis TaxID=1609977 RepID=A0A7U4J7N9_9SPHN|nr:mannose-6-phosphate isomerase [Sphingomonas hengshuiensis]